MGSTAWIFGIAVIVWAMALIYYDLRYFRLPNVLTLGGGLVSVILSLVYDWHALLSGLVWVLLSLAIYRFGLGMGDIKLALPLGILIGLSHDEWFLPLCGAIIGASVMSVLFLCVARQIKAAARFHKIVPHGPSMILSSLFSCAISLI
ncbi:MAG: A24 family peptidase [Corynebacterium sp.]|nr:A24 family peptidase [Corynebacterium sp.]